MASIPGHKPETSAPSATCVAGDTVHAVAGRVCRVEAALTGDLGKILVSVAQAQAAVTEQLAVDPQMQIEVADQVRTGIRGLLRRRVQAVVTLRISASSPDNCEAIVDVFRQMTC